MFEAAVAIGIAIFCSAIMKEGIWWVMERARSKIRATENHFDDVVFKCFEAGVMQTYESTVKLLKAASEGGKLSQEDRAQALDSAWNIAQEEAQLMGVELVDYYTPGLGKVVIQGIVNQLKK